jgi:hypothetical protein
VNDPTTFDPDARGPGFALDVAVAAPGATCSLCHEPIPVGSRVLLINPDPIAEAPAGPRGAEQAWDWDCVLGIVGEPDYWERSRRERQARLLREGKVLLRHVTTGPDGQPEFDGLEVEAELRDADGRRLAIIDGRRIVLDDDEGR